MADLEYNQIAKIKVVGIGGAGSNAVNRMVQEGVQGVEFYVANTDLQALDISPVANKIQLGKEGLGAGGNPDMGRKAAVDSLIIISNNKVLEVIGHIPFEDAFKEADNILRQGVQTITDLIACPAMINLDFADIKSVMEGQGSALFGIGMADGDNKAQEAAQRAI